MTTPMIVLASEPFDGLLFQPCPTRSPRSGAANARTPKPTSATSSPRRRRRHGDGGQLARDLVVAERCAGSKWRAVRSARARRAAGVTASGVRGCPDTTPGPVQRSKRCGSGTTRTGRSAWCRAAIATLPSRISRRADRPREPTTMTAAPRSAAQAASASATARALWSNPRGSSLGQPRQREPLGTQAAIGQRLGRPSRRRRECDAFPRDPLGVGRGLLLSSACSCSRLRALRQTRRRTSTLVNAGAHRCTSGPPRPAAAARRTRSPPPRSVTRRTRREHRSGYL
jgi:hypothetical protein